MKFKYWLCEMASFTLPPSMNVRGPDGPIGGVDMRFEGPPAYDPPFNRFNMGSQFVAKMPNSNEYIVYGGWGDVKVMNEPQAKATGFPQVPDYWYQRAEILGPDYNVIKPAQGDASGERGDNSTKMR